MPAKSKAQQQAAGAALSAKRGERSETQGRVEEHGEVDEQEGARENGQRQPQGQAEARIE
jgi:hypothetical protein